MKILLVEDEEILVKVMEEKLEREKFEVKTVRDGDSVLPAVKSFNPDIILLDIILPKKDGLQVLADIKADSEISHIPVITMSNLGDDEKIKAALKLGAADYLVKTQHPINEIVNKIRELGVKAK